MKRFWLGLWVGLGLILAGCATGGDPATEEFVDSMQSTEVDTAAMRATQEAERRARSDSAILFRMEQGARLRMASRFNGSNEAFGSALEMIQAFRSGDSEITFSERTYIPPAHEMVMLHFYRALNFMHLGNAEFAREALDEMAASRASQQTSTPQDPLIEDGLQILALERARADELFQEQMTLLEAEIEGLPAYKEDLIPVARYLEGLFFMFQGREPKELDRAKRALELKTDLVPKLKASQEDLQLLAELREGEPTPELTYVIFETGLSPKLVEVKVQLPLGKEKYAPGALSRLSLQGNFLPRLRAGARGAKDLPYALPLASIDWIVADWDRTERPGRIAKALTRVAARPDEALSSADVRIWTTMGKEFHVARMPTPPSRVIELKGIELERVMLIPGRVNVLYVRSTSAEAPLVIQQFLLK